MSAWIAKDDEGKIDLDNLSTQKWLEGQASGAEAVIGFLETRAAELFRQRKLEIATSMQKLCDEIRALVVMRLEKQAKDHKKDYPFRIP